MSKEDLTIAIDGPVGSGKGTLSSLLAQKLNAMYLYTGGMYRALALACIRENVDIYEAKDVIDLFKKARIDLSTEGSENKVFLNGEDVTREIFFPKVSNITPIIASYPEVRRAMVEKQREMIKGKRVVVEGRDTATDIAPDADIKIYLTADVRTRADRRLRQLKEKGLEESFEDVLFDTQERDRRDMKRDASPLTVTQDTLVIDTTNDKVEDTIEKVVSELTRRKLI